MEAGREWTQQGQNTDGETPTEGASEDGPGVSQDHQAGNKLKYIRFCTWVQIWSPCTLLEHFLSWHFLLLYHYNSEMNIILLLVFVLTTTKQIEINIIKRVALYKNLFKSWFTTELNQPRSPNLSHLGYLGFHRLTRRYSDVTEVLSCCASSTRGWANYVDPAVTQMSAVSSSSSSPAAFDRLKQNCLKPVDIIPKCPKWKCLCLVG